MNPPIFSSPEEYFDLATKLHALIMADFESTPPDALSAHYSKMVVMHEFYRLIRGEAFLDIRPSVGERQQQLYALEDEIGQRLATLRQQLDPADASLRFHIEEMKCSFDVERGK